MIAMESRPLQGGTLFFEAGDEEAAIRIGEICDESARLITDCWGITPPKQYRAYVLTSYIRFMFHAAPWPRRILFAFLVVFWWKKIKRMWKWIGGCTHRWKRRPAIGVKPPRLLELADKSIGERIKTTRVPEDMDNKLRMITCHEMTHAFTAHLRLPMWLNEGVAMVTVDRFLGEVTVKRETLETLGSSTCRKPGEYRNILKMGADALVYNYVRGYWITRYLEETHPRFLREMLGRRRRQKVLEKEIAAAMGFRRRDFWRSIDARVVAHFNERDELEEA